MPELPEVETIKRDLDRLLVGKKIIDISSDSPKQLKPSLAAIKKAAIKTSIKKISRRAKLLIVYLSNGKILAFHLKLTGRLLVRKKSDPKDSWQHITFSLTNSQELRFADLRKFGWIKLIKNEKELSQLLSEFGPEPLQDLKQNQFQAILKSSRRPIKVILMDQTKISGIGNIYACDALNLAAIDPRRPANKITPKESKKLLTSIQKVLKAGIRYRGASDQYYLDALGHQGSYQDHFLVYNRAGKSCFQCGGEIKKIKLAARGTYFCPQCQH